MRVKWIAIVAALSVSAACFGGLVDCAQAQDSAQKLTGVTAWNQLVGNSVTGKEDGSIPASASNTPSVSAGVGAKKGILGDRGWACTRRPVKDADLRLSLEAPIRNFLARCGG